MADFSVETKDINEIRPLGDKLLVAPLPKERITAGGIIIPDTSNKPAMLGTVLSAGPGITTELGALIPMPVKRGDIIAFNRYAGVDVRTDKGSYLLMRQDDLIAKLEATFRMDEEDKDVFIGTLQAMLMEAADLAHMEKTPTKDQFERWDAWTKIAHVKFSDIKEVPCPK